MKRPQLETLPVTTTESGHFPHETSQAVGGVVLSGLSILTELPATPMMPTSTIGVPPAEVTTTVVPKSSAEKKGAGIGFCFLVTMMVIGFLV
jgi:hypothetical protein